MQLVDDLFRPPHVAEIKEPVEVFPHHDFRPVLELKVDVIKPSKLWINFAADVLVRLRKKPKYRPNMIRQSRGKTLDFRILLDNTFFTGGFVHPFELPERIALHLTAVRIVDPGFHIIVVGWKIATGLVGRIDPKDEIPMMLRIVAREDPNL